MKILILLLTLLSLGYGKQYVFLVDKYDKEIDLEAKIISRVATSSLNQKVKLYIPHMSEQEHDIYSKYFDLTKECSSANFIFDKKGLSDEKCKKSGKLFFTNNYKKLLSDEKYFGAFFWNKSRPNIVFIKQRLNNNNISLSKEYAQFIEDIDD